MTAVADGGGQRKSLSAGKGGPLVDLGIARASTHSASRGVLQIEAAHQTAMIHALMPRVRRVPGAGVKKAPPSEARRVLLFIDDSNLFIEGQRTAAQREPQDVTARSRFRVDFGRLLEWIAENRRLTDVYLVGSRPPEADSFWKILPKRGIRSKIFDRHAGREKGVDHDLVAEMIEATIREEKDKANTTVALVAGDGDYRSTLDRLNSRGWNLEVYFWTSGTSALIRDTSWYIDLDPHFREFCYFEHPK